MYTELDISKWTRKTTYEFFRDYEDPFFNITGNIDISSVYSFCKKADLVFSLVLLYYSLVAANAIREFRIRLVGGHLVEYDRIHATQTVLNEDETFSFAYFEMTDGVNEFNRLGKEALEKYKALKTFEVESNRSDLIYYSVVPWVSFTSIKHASRLDKLQTVPRIVFGKLFSDNRRMLLPLSVEANHAIMDGFHVGKFFTDFQAILNSSDSH
jgi:chloramphenicol O-acetyltransferase type A